MGLFRKRDHASGADDAWGAPERPEDLPDAMADLAFMTLGHALESISEGGPLIPLVLVEGAEGRAAHRFVADTLEEGIAKASNFVAGDPQWQRATLAYDGYLSAEGQRTDAIYVLAWDRPSRTAVQVAHRYLPGGPAAPLQRVGAPMYLGSAAGPGVSPVG